MFYTIAAALIILWLLGMVSGYTIGGLVHFLLLVVALVMVPANFFSRRKGA